MRASSIAMSTIMLAVFAAMTGIALLVYPEGARAQPLIIGVPAIVLCVLQLALDLRSGTAADRAPASAPPVPAREIRVWLWFLALISGVLLAGFWVAVPAFLIGFLALEARVGAGRALAWGLGATAVLYGVFGGLLKASLHDGFLLQWLKG